MGDFISMLILKQLNEKMNNKIKHNSIELADQYNNTIKFFIEEEENKQQFVIDGGIFYVSFEEFDVFLETLKQIKEKLTS